ncbi:MAG TPA: substrate-binding domain-containing protein [Pyrinomonadaceae bacterium]|nr:substrate-binding domain-containing protein [Pyrinomonadaceae bacterium]
MSVPILAPANAVEERLLSPSLLLRTLQRGDLAIIVHKSNPVQNLSMAELREYFLAERSHWSTQQKIRVAMREPGSPEREAVLRLICGMKRDQDFTTYFLRAKFSEQVVDEPRSLDSTPNMIRFVANVSGAIGYVRADEVDPSVRVIRVDNLLPGDPDYKLVLP